jgi:endonuclease YncB( thermonuclease family)
MQQAQGRSTESSRDGTVELQAKDITLQTHGNDKYRRTLADVLLHDGTNVNHMLAKDG